MSPHGRRAFGSPCQHLWLHVMSTETKEPAMKVCDKCGAVEDVKPPERSDPCPRCRSRLDIKPHCSSLACDLIACGVCRGYGRRDGRLWTANMGWTGGERT
jgi:hypothetical protein